MEKAGFKRGEGRVPTKGELIAALAGVGITIVDIPMAEVGIEDVMGLPVIVGDAEREAMLPEEVQICTCDNCGWSGPDSDTDEVENVMQRVAPGEIMPVGECPDCGALVHLPVTSET